VILFSASFAIGVTLYFWWENTKGIPGIERKSAPHHEAGDGHGGDPDHLVYLHVALIHLRTLPPLPDPTTTSGLAKARWDGLAHSSLPHMFGIVAIFIALGHSGAGDERRGIAGAVIPRN